MHTIHRPYIILTTNVAIVQRFERSNVQRDRKEQSDIYGKYNFTTKFPVARLPIEDHRHRILDTIRENTVVVLRGPTGKYLNIFLIDFNFFTWNNNQLLILQAVARQQRCHNSYWMNTVKKDYFATLLQHSPDVLLHRRMLNVCAKNVVGHADHLLGFK